MKIYTRRGDSGETTLLGGGRVPKSHTRVDAYGDVDETNSAIGLALSAIPQNHPTPIRGPLEIVQEDLFAIGAHLATPGTKETNRATDHLPPLPAARIAELEAWIDEVDERLGPLRNFILPGGTDLAARLHLARTVCRRAERRVVALAATEPVDERIIIYLNRLSDLLFTYARLANQEAGRPDVSWIGRQSL